MAPRALRSGDLTRDPFPYLVVQRREGRAGAASRRPGRERRSEAAVVGGLRGEHLHRCRHVCELQLDRVGRGAHHDRRGLPDRSQRATPDRKPCPRHPSCVVKQAPVRRPDPDRRGRLIDVALDIIADVGVAGVSHRKIATAADVPLGSMTYHFDGMDDVLTAAFTRFADHVADEFEAVMCRAADRDAAVAALVGLITELFDSDRNLVLTIEFYALAARDVKFRSLTSAWMGRSRAALERHFDPLTARLLDALIEGLSLHLALERDRSDRAVEVRTAIERITTI
ncbi:TetR family transcriptional regulator [Cryobacterium sp. 1639]|nr:TetR family transcriptional regulator [Cryobacterium sp. 1639]